MGLYLVESFDSGIVSEEIQALPVRLPQEFHPRSQHLAIRSILRRFARYGGQKEGFWRGQLHREKWGGGNRNLASKQSIKSKGTFKPKSFFLYLVSSYLVQIFNVQNGLLGRFSRFFGTFLCQFEEATHHVLEGLDVDLLANIFILVEALLGDVTLPQIHAELEVLLHNRFVNLLPCSMLFRFDDIVQGVESSLKNSFDEVDILTLIT